MTKKRLIIAVILFSIAGYIIFTGQNKISPDQRIKIAALTGDINTAPDFKLFDVQTDSVFTLSQLKGKVVVLNFWATWCYPCRLEIPDFNELHKKHGDDLVILGVSISDTQKTLQNFMKSFAIDYPVLYGSSNEITRVSMEYGGINAVPTSFIIGKNGELVKSYPGAILKGQPMYFNFIQVLESELGKKS